MKNKIIILLLLVSFFVGAVQLLSNRSVSTDANSGATQHAISSNIDGTTSPTIINEGAFFDGLAGVTMISELDALSGASTSRDEYDDDDDEHEDEYEHEDEHEDESEYDD